MNQPYTPPIQPGAPLARMQTGLRKFDQNVAQGMQGFGSAQAAPTIGVKSQPIKTYAENPEGTAAAGMRQFGQDVGQAFSGFGPGQTAPAAPKPPTPAPAPPTSPTKVPQAAPAATAPAPATATTPPVAPTSNADQIISSVLKNPQLMYGPQEVTQSFGLVPGVDYDPTGGLSKLWGMDMSFKPSAVPGAITPSERKSPAETIAALLHAGGQTEQARAMAQAARAEAAGKYPTTPEQVEAAEKMARIRAKTEEQPLLERIKGDVNRDVGSVGSAAVNAGYKEGTEEWRRHVREAMLLRNQTPESIIKENAIGGWPWSYQSPEQLENTRVAQLLARSPAGAAGATP
jgi:hypothetical protein